jgi:uncharacterized membrane protein
VSEKNELSRSIEESIDVEVRTRTAYDQWTRFEDFPMVMRDVRAVRQLGDEHLSWKVEVRGRPVEWVAEIVEQIPDKRIAWRTTSGARHAGVVTFHRIEDEKCRVVVQIDYAPDGLAQSAADLLGVVRREIRGGLEEFKSYLETKGSSGAGWRGEIASRDDVPAEEQAASTGSSAEQSTS